MDPLPLKKPLMGEGSHQESLEAGLPVYSQDDWDPDIVAALEDNFDFDDPDNQLEDDFIVKAMTGNGDDDDDDIGLEDDEGDSINSADDEINLSSADEYRRTRYDSEGTKSCFTNYSLTAANVPRNKALSLLDQQFENLFEKEYGEDTEIGALDLEPIEGHVDTNRDERIKKMTKSNKKDEYIDPKQMKKFINQKYHYETNGQDRDETQVVELESGGKHADDRMDCESILSTYSNLYNHPRLIMESKVQKRIKVNPKTGVPSTSGLTAAGLKRFDRMTGEGDSQSLVSSVSKMSVRSKDETPEEKKLRKAQVKEVRRERRQEKKANRDAFKDEQKRLQKESINVKQNLSVVRLL